ncbi:MAG: hypothetical protein B6A08_14995 [Sorangiineae bacterium NIC37A_2]|nr:MAG: hypothetical protein B6A08_14995 [Sorangiineae bacterium NIC37A_2]
MARSLRSRALGASLLFANSILAVAIPARAEPGLVTARADAERRAPAPAASGPAELARGAFERLEAEHARHPERRPGTKVLSLRDALQEAVKRGPEVLVALAPRASLLRAEQTAAPTLLQPPSLSAQLGPRFLDDRIAPEFIVGISQPLSLSRQGALQKQVAKGELRLQEESLRLEKIAAAMAAGNAWLDLALTHNLLELRRASLDEAEKLRRLAETRVRLGQADPLELAVARAEAARSRALLLEAEGAHFAASADLSLALGLEAARVESDGGLPPPPPWNEGKRAEEERWTEARLLAEESLAGARAKLARAQQSPGLSVGVQYQREGTGEQVLTGTLTMPLFDFKPGRYQEALLLAEQDKLSQAAKGQRQKAKVERDRAAHEEAHAQVLFELLSKEALPAARQAVKIVTAKYELGEVDISRVALHRQQLLTLEENAAVALAAVHRAVLGRLKATGLLLEEYSL